MKKKIATVLICLLTVLCFLSACKHEQQPDVTASPVLSDAVISATPLPTPVLPVVDVKLTSEGKIVDPYRIYTSDSCAQDVLSMGQLYPSVVSVESIGQSTAGKEMYVLKLGNGPTKILITAATHARENVTTNYVMRQAEELAVAYMQNKPYEGYDIVQLLSNFTLYISPMNNPDGVDICNAYAEPIGFSNVTDWTKTIWKANGRGVDINRNFPFEWENMKANDKENTKPSKMNYPGDTAASEAETQNLMRLVQNNDFQFCLNFHTKGKILYWHDPVNGDISGDSKLVNLLHDCLGFTIAGTTQNVRNYGGGFENWFRSVTDKPGICIEMTTGGEGDVPYNHPNRADLCDNVYDIYSEQVLDWNNSKALFPYILENYF